MGLSDAFNPQGILLLGGKNVCLQGKVQNTSWWSYKTDISRVNDRTLKNENSEITRSIKLCIKIQIRADTILQG